MRVKWRPGWGEARRGEDEDVDKNEDDNEDDEVRTTVTGG